MLLRTEVGPRLEGIGRRSLTLINRIHRVVEANQRVADKGCDVRHAIDVYVQSGWHAVEGEIHFLRIDRDDRTVLETGRVLDGQRDSVARIAAEVAACRWNL